MLNDVVLAGLNLNNTVHTNAGTYTDTWTFSNPNYSNASGTIIDTILKANANIVVNGYTVNYNGAAHEATDAAYGVGGVVLSGLNLSGTIHVGVGTYHDTWTFSNPNYNSVSVTVVDIVHPALVKIVSVTKKTAQFIIIQFNGVVEQNISDYRLVTIPPNSKTKSQVVVLSQAIYNPANNTVELVTRNPLVPSIALELTVKVYDTIGRPVTGTATIT